MAVARGAVGPGVAEPSSAVIIAVGARRKALAGLREGPGPPAPACRSEAPPGCAIGARAAGVGAVLAVGVGRVAAVLAKASIPTEVKRA